MADSKTVTKAEKGGYALHHKAPFDRLTILLQS